MHILLLNYEFPPIGGGAGLASAEIATRLVRQGISVDVVTSCTDPGGSVTQDVLRGPEGGSDAGSLTVHRVRSRRRGVHEAGLGGAGHYLVSAGPLVQKLVRSGRYDLAHIFFSLPTGALLPAFRGTDIPIIVALRGSDVPGYDSSNRTLRAAHVLLRPITRRIWRRADRVVALSRALGQLAQRTQPTLRFSVIYNGVDTELFKPKQQSRSSDRVVRCLAVARLVARKGLANVIHAWRQLERGRFPLEIVGSGPLDQDLRQLVSQHHLDSEIHFTGALDRTAVASRFQQADLFVLTPRNEAFGNVFAEALASGLPVVGSHVGGIPEFVRQGEHGTLVPPDDPAVLAVAVRRLGESPELRREIGARNRSYAETSLSWERAAERYAELYRELIARCHGVED